MYSIILLSSITKEVFEYNKAGTYKTSLNTYNPLAYSMMVDYNENSNTYNPFAYNESSNAYNTFAYIMIVDYNENSNTLVILANSITYYKLTYNAIID